MRRASAPESETRGQRALLIERHLFEPRFPVSELRSGLLESNTVSSDKIFVLDTSVILHDFNAFNSFDEHDVVIPITVLEELDSFKKGNNVINLQARSFMRELDRLSESADI